MNALTLVPSVPSHPRACALVQSLGNPLFYPFQVARTLMIVNGTELEIARKTPDFTSPMHCLNYLSLQPSHRGLMRGANILRRFTWVE